HCLTNCPALSLRAVERQRRDTLGAVSIKDKEGHPPNGYWCELLIQAGGRCLRCERRTGVRAHTLLTNQTTRRLGLEFFHHFLADSDRGATIMTLSLPQQHRRALRLAPLRQPTKKHHPGGTR